MLLESNKSSLKWKFGLITSLHDGFTHSVTLMTENGEVTRGVIHLYPLEIRTNTST